MWQIAGLNGVKKPKELNSWYLCRIYLKVEQSKIKDGQKTS